MDISKENKLLRFGYTILKYIIIFYPILLSVTRFIAIIDTILTASLIILLGILVTKKNKKIIKYMILGSLFIMSTYIHYDKSSHIEHVKVLLIFFLTFDCYQMKYYEKFLDIIKKNSGIIIFQLVIIIIFNLISMFASWGYSDSYSESWGIRAFQGVYSDPHQAAYHLCAILIYLVSISNKKANIMYCMLVIIVEYCILMTGARVPTGLSIFIGIIYFADNKTKIIVSRYNNSINTIVSYIPLMIVGIMGIYLVLSYTSFGSKIINSSSSIHFDNGRSILRKQDINLFSKSTITRKLFGNGTGAVKSIHKSGIWSHNDFFQIMCGMGLFVLIMYSFEYIKVIKDFLFNKKMLGIIYILLCAIVAFYNGLYIHSRLVFAIPILFEYFKIRKESI